MTPGWYNAQGDPPGSQRYWDGSQWIGEPVYEPAPAPVPAASVPPLTAYPPPTPYAAPVAYPMPVASTFPSMLKVMAIVVSVLKAIPLAFGAFAVVLLGAFAEAVDDDIDDDLFNDFEGLFRSLAAFLLVIVLIGALLIGFQFVGALREKPMMVFVPALIMSILDSLSTLGSWVGFASAQGSTFDNPSAAGPLLITTITAAQIAIAVQAIRANKS